MAGKDKYVAYVSSYTSGLGTKYGIRIYDVDLKQGRLTEKQKWLLSTHLVIQQV